MGCGVHCQVSALKKEVEGLRSEHSRALEEARRASEANKDLSRILSSLEEDVRREKHRADEGEAELQQAKEQAETAKQQHSRCVCVGGGACGGGRMTWHVCV